MDLQNTSNANAPGSVSRDSFWVGPGFSAGKGRDIHFSTTGSSSFSASPQVDTGLGKTESSTVRCLNAKAEALLGGFAWLGKQYDSWRGIESSSAAKVLTASSAVNTAQEALSELGVANSVKAFKGRYVPANFTPGPVSRFVGAAGASLEAVSGILSVASSYRRDYEAGRGPSAETMTNIFSTVAQTSSASVAAGLAGGTAAALVGGVVAPVIIGGAAAIGAGYLMGRVVGWIRAN